MEELGLMARGVGGTVRRHTKHNSPVPWTGGELDRQRISGYSTSGASDSLEIPVTPLWVMATETLTSARLAYRDLAPIFMIRAVVKTWKTS
ncbi:MAG: hypothetical protein DMG57_23675 [Acidobacteria bacterium]|nr:MAG: hypothetical protein DMG57_23675 [Acidobacteriota bacterium]